MHVVVRNLSLDRQAGLRPQHVEIEDVHFRTQLRPGQIVIGKAETCADAGSGRIGVMECVGTRENAHVRGVGIEDAIADFAVEAGQRRFLSLQDRDRGVVNVKLELVADGAVGFVGDVGIGTDVPVRGHRFETERKLIEGMIELGLRAVEAGECAENPFGIDFGAVTQTEIEIAVVVAMAGISAEAHECQRVEVLPERHERGGAADRKAAACAAADIDIRKPFRRIDWLHRLRRRGGRSGSRRWRCGWCVGGRRRRGVGSKSRRAHRGRCHARNTDKKFRFQLQALPIGVAHAVPQTIKEPVPPWRRLHPLRP